jgi:hypothetical protein
MNKLLLTCLSAVVLLATSVSSHAADVTITTPTGSGFAVLNSNGAATLKVDGTGNVVIPSLPLAPAGIPLCWNETSGVISRCSVGTAAADTTPPVITTTAPAVATGYKTTFTTTYTDNVELAYITRPTVVQSTSVEVLAAGVNTIQIDSSFDLPLDRAYPTSRTVIASDKAGNLTKKAITIALPETGVKPGKYLTVGSYSTPIGFNCLPGLYAGNGYSDNFNVAGVEVGDSWLTGYLLNVPYTGWSLAGGYRPMVSMRSAMVDGVDINRASMGAYPNIPLASTVFTLENPTFYISSSGGGVSYVMRYTGAITKTQSSPPTINVTMTMQCNINNAGYVNGTTASFTAQMAQ